MAYTVTKGYLNDIFVSYSHADDEPVLGSDIRWVTNFVDDLRKFLSRKLGNREGQSPTIWMDHELNRNVPLNAALPAAIQKSATYLIVMSPAYLESQWCAIERKHFFDELRRRGSSTRVFIIEIDEIDRKLYPIDINEYVVPFKFWHKTDSSEVLTLGIPDRDNEEYYTRLMDVISDMAKELKNILKETNSQPEVRDATSGESIFLAEVTDDLDDKREEIKRYLKDEGYRIIPDENGYKNYDLDSLRANIESNLAGCPLYVQLLSNLPGKKLSGNGDSITSYQFEIASLWKKKMMVWCSPGLAVETVRDVKLLKIFESEYLRKEGMEDFKKAIKDSLCEPKVNEPIFPDHMKFVYICTDIKDWEYSEKVIKKEIRTAGFGSSLPIRSPKASVVRNYQRQNFIESYATVFVYCESEPDTVLSQILDCAKAKALRKQPFKAVAIFDGPPKTDEEGRIEIDFPSLEISNLNCRKNIDEFVEKFLKKL